MKIRNPDHIFLYDIRNYCNNFLSKKISLDYFQSYLQEHLDNWGNEIPVTTQNIVGDFIGSLETDQFMYDEPERSKIIKQKTKKLLECINKILPSNIDELMEDYNGDYL